MPALEGSGKAFSLNFRQLVVPRLKNLILAYARCLVADVETYPTACDCILRYAWTYGAAYLSDREFYQLRDWIGGELLRLLIAMEARPEPWLIARERLEQLTRTPVPRTAWPERSAP